MAYNPFRLGKAGFFSFFVRQEKSSNLCGDTHCPLPILWALAGVYQ